MFNSLQPYGQQLGVSRQEDWSGLSCPPLEDLPDPGVEFRSLALQADSLPSEPPGKPKGLIAVCMMGLAAKIIQ